MVNASEGIELLTLIKQAHPVVKITIALLILASIMSWTMIFRKWFTLKAASMAANRFEKQFWSGTNLNQMYTSLTNKKDTQTGMAGLFVGGFREYRRLEQQKNVKPQEVLDGVQRAMRVALTRETDFLETNLSFLATVGSTSPYVGLFGTVWGIMNSFRALASPGAQNNAATIMTVAPGIAEALIATAMGLFAAIPAVIAFNRYSHNAERLLTRYEIFSEEFLSIIQRQILKAKM